MLVLAMLMLAAPGAPVPQTRKHSIVVRTARPLPRLLTRADTACRNAACRSAPDMRYRIEPEPLREETTMQRAIDALPPTCGITGAPVCTSHRRPLLRAWISP